MSTRRSTLSIFAGLVTLWMMIFRESFQRQPTWLVLLEALGLVGLIGWVDHVTTWELNCFVLYAAPIILVAWKTDRRLGFVFAFLCAAADWVADGGGNPYRTHWGFMLVVAGEGFYFSVLVVAVTAAKSRRELDRMRIETLERAQSLERQILRTSEREQQRIGRDLHDSLGPQLAAIRYGATLLANELRQHGRAEAAQAEHICELTGTAGLLVRDLARGAFPVQMDGAGLAMALNELAGTTSRLTGIPVSFYDMGGILVENPEYAMHLYRIAQEAVNNAAKHGVPRKITIVLSKIRDSLRLTVADDGKGMDSPPGGTRGMGLNSMKYRARVLGGELTIDSNPGEGTIVSCDIPNSANRTGLPAS